MAEQKAAQLIGRIRKTIPQSSYGFILTDAGQEFFFHARNAVDRKLHAVGDVVRFTPVHLDLEGKKDRAINVEVLG